MRQGGLRVTGQFLEALASRYAVCELEVRLVEERGCVGAQTVAEGAHAWAQETL